MTDEIAVVKPHYLIEEAYSQGYERFHPTDLPHGTERSLDPFYDTAEYSNRVLPGLRAMAGYEDRGHGTYTIERDVAAISPGCEEDEPADALLVSCAEVYEALTDAWSGGAWDAMGGAERRPDEHHW
jgi:hypothetical protein